jgi:DNA-binding NtrC family response regulator
VLVATGRLARAEALVSTLRAEAIARRDDIPCPVRVRHAEICFWYGRFEEARAHLPAGPAATAEEAGIERLVKWATGEASLPEPGDVALSARLARACMAEDQLAHGRLDEARKTLGPPPARPSDAQLEEALLERLRQACGTGPPPRTPATEDFIRRHGARGLERWGMRRTGVHLLHAVPALLQIVHDAEDELAALEAGCAWVRAHVGAEAAGLVATDAGPRLVAADALTERDLTTGVIRDAIAAPAGRVVARDSRAAASAPVRAQGVTIGVAVALGRPEIAGSLAEGAALLASLCAPAMRGRLDALATAGAGQSLAPEILGESPAIVAVRDAIARAAVTSFPVLIEGESGTGKELAARALHRLSARRDRRMSAVNCAALSDELVEAELFGYTRGAFTGAIGVRAGLFEDASGSTLLLDEVSELSARAQAKLLRALQEREIRRLGENVPRPVDVRVLAATNRPLADEVGRGRFREDLLFRLAVVRIRLPALRERVEDVPQIAQAYWRRMLAEVGKRAALGADALAAMARHAWPGNVRELQNVVAGLALVAPARGRVSARHVAQVLAGRELSSTRVLSLDDARRLFERQQVAAALARHAGHRAAAADELGLTRQGLAKAMKRLGLESVCDTAGVA